MPLGVREILFIMRARDEASRTITSLGSVFGQVGTRAQTLGGQMVGVGSAMTAVGTGIGAVGAGGLAFFNSAIDAAAEYDKQVGLTLTQVDKQNIKFKDLHDLGLDIAKHFPVALESIQPALYDIFSSMDVGLSGAKTLIEGFARAATAGNVDIQTAGRATIQIMNAFKIPVTDTNKVLDVQFQLVRKGVGTYEEFASTIGRAIPSTLRAGQSVETLAGMLAFLTRNSLSTAMASSSAARAMDAMAHPVVAQRLEAMGIQVRDANGEFRPLVDTIRDMNEKFGNMTAPDRAKALQELFKGAGGTIQARRFFDLVFKNFDQFEAYVGDMQNAGGALDQAFTLMLDRPANKAQLLKNRFEALRIEIGDQLLPIKVKLMSILEKVLKAWDDLDPAVKNAIIYAGVLISVFLVLSGIILVVGGSILVLIGMFLLISTPVLIVIGVIALVIAAIIALALAIYYNWGGIRDFVEGLWNDIVDIFERAKAQIIKRWNDLVEAAKRLWHRIEDSINNTLDDIQKAFKDVWSDIENWWNSFGPQFIQDILDLWHDLEDGFNEVWDPIQETVQHAINFILGVIQVGIAIIMFLWNEFGDNILRHVEIVWHFIQETISNAIEVIKGIIKIVTGIINGDWTTVWNGIKDFFGGIWDEITNILSTALDLFINWFEALPGRILSALGDLLGLLVQKGWDLIAGLATGAANKAFELMLWIISLPSKIFSALGDLTEVLKQKGIDLLEGLWKGLKQKAKSILDWAGDFANDVIDTITHPWDMLSPSKVMHGVGVNFMKGLHEGLKEYAPTVLSYMDDFAMQVPTTTLMPAPTTTQPLPYQGGDINVNVRTDANPYEISRELVWAQITNPHPMPSQVR